MTISKAPTASMELPSAKTNTTPVITCVVSLAKVSPAQSTGNTNSRLKGMSWHEGICLDCGNEGCLVCVAVIVAVSVHFYLHLYEETCSSVLEGSG